MMRTIKSTYISIGLSAICATGCSTLPDGGETLILDPTASTQQPLSHGWSKSTGGSGSTMISYGIAVDSSDNLTVVGNVTSASIDFGGGALNGGYGSYVAQFDSSGNHVWSKRFDDVDILSVTADSVDNVIVVGAIASTIDFGGGPVTNPGGYGLVVAQFDSSGNHIWSRRYGGADGTYPYDVAIDSSDNIVITGEFSGNLSIGSDSGSAGNGIGVFVTKVDSSGDPIFSKFFTEAPGATYPYGNFGFGQSVAVDAEDNIVISGAFMGTFDFGGGPLASSNGELAADAFITKLDSDGDFLWVQHSEGGEWISNTDVATSGSGDIVVCGGFYGTLTFGANTLTSAGNVDGFVVQFDENGNYAWSDSFGDVDYDNPQDLSIDSSGNIVIAGTFQGSINLGGSTLTSAGGMDAFVAQFDDGGALLWNARYGDTSYQVAANVAMDSNENANVVGTFAGTVDFGGGSLTTSAGSMFLVQLTP